MSATQETVLLVDDNPTNLEVLYQTLESEGYRLLAARGGEAALKIVEETVPTLVLLDIMMPGIDGFQVCQRIKANPATEEVAVIFLSALGDTETKVKGFGLGAVDYISKPFQSEEIVARVANHVKIRQLERQLSSRNVELESEITRILSTMSEGVYGLDVEGRITYANPAACVMSGYSEEELVGQDAFALHMYADENGEPRSLDNTPYQRAFEEGVRIEVDCEVVWRKNKSFVYAAMTCTPSVEHGEVTGAVVVFRDITSRLEAEAELHETRQELGHQRQRLAHIERLSTMGEMAAGFAHEVNQPLTAIANYASVSKRLADKEDIDREKLGSALDKMQNQALRASEVIQRLRNFVKIPTKGGKKIMEASRLVEEVINLAEVDSQKNQVPIHFEAADNLPPVYIDDIQIQQVLLNLVRNGMESMSGTERSAEGIQVKLTEPQAGMVRFSVADRGIGLAADAEDKLFHPFYTTKDDGMGIGLSVCASIIQDHGGEIAFTRNPDGGTTFYFDLAAKDGAEAARL